MLTICLADVLSLQPAECVQRAAQLTLPNVLCVPNVFCVLNVFFVPHTL
jgi:hypothetical protein